MKQFAVIGLTVLLAACGGGDSAAPSTPPPTVAAEGFWERTVLGGSVALVILGNGATLGVYTSGGAIVGALYGNTTASGTTLTGSGKYFNIRLLSVTPGDYSGTFVAKKSLDVTTFMGSTSSPFWGAYTRKADDQPALPAVVEGTFVGVGGSRSSLLPIPSLTISGTGAITVPSFPGCSVSGTATPHPGGKNIFNVTMNFNGVLCLLGKGDFPTGIAFYDTTTRQVVVMALKADQSDSFIFVGEKIP